MLQVDELASMLDHAIIDANATESDMHAGIDIAVKYRIATFVILEDLPRRLVDGEAERADEARSLARTC